MYQFGYHGNICGTWRGLLVLVTALVILTRRVVPHSRVGRVGVRRVNNLRQTIYCSELCSDVCKIPTDINPWIIITVRCRPAIRRPGLSIWLILTSRKHRTSAPIVLVKDRLSATLQQVAELLLFRNSTQRILNRSPSATVARFYAFAVRYAANALMSSSPCVCVSVCVSYNSAVELERSEILTKVVFR